ncbi:hypothetical protein A9977_04710 [Variovorax sp. UMC13]|nr:hypothetical protein [Variovorax sp. UMC13]
MQPTLTSVVPTEKTARGSSRMATALTDMVRLPVKKGNSVGASSWMATRTELLSSDEMPLK